MCYAVKANYNLGVLARLASHGIGFEASTVGEMARALAADPPVLLMDEPCSALDPIATRQVEDLMVELKEKYTVAIVTHNMQQAARVSARRA